jgi:hypothetical protein
MTTDALRKLYIELRSLATYDSPRDDRDLFDDRVRAAIDEAGQDATPEAFVRAAKTVRVPCRRCAGTGQFITYVENGRPRGPGGRCYRCGGTGTQDAADGKRNAAYDNFHMRPI